MFIVQWKAVHLYHLYNANTTLQGGQGMTKRTKEKKVKGKERKATQVGIDWTYARREYYYFDMKSK